MFNSETWIITPLPPWTRNKTAPNAWRRINSDGRPGTQPFPPPFPLPLLVLIRQWNSKLHNRWSLSLWHKENLSSHLPRLYSHHLTRHPPNVGARSSSYPLASTFDLLTTDHSCHFSSSCCYNRMHVKFAWFLLSFGSRGFHFPLHKSVRSLLNVRTRVVSRLPSVSIPADVVPFLFRLVDLCRS